MNKTNRQPYKAGIIVFTIVLMVIAFLAGYLLKRISEPVPEAAQQQIATAEPVQEQTWWTCSMHPQIRQPKSGKCPICFMDLIPVASEQAGIGPRQISFSEDALKLM
jgi:Cu(I)/Ag(I) efflux system membrane fusion protein